MKPGDVVTCSNCGGAAVACSTNPAAWREGYPVLLRWPDGRDETIAHWPERCLSCHERFQVLGHDTPPPQPPGPMRAPPAPRDVGEGPLNDREGGRPGGSASPALPGGNKAPLERPAARGQLSLL